LSKADEETKWDKVEKAIEEAIGLKIGYTRLNGTEGHFAVNLNELNAEAKEKVNLDGMMYLYILTRFWLLKLSLEKLMLRLKSVVVMI